jgi:hypothetical protein
VLRLKGEEWLFCCREKFYKEEVEIGEREKWIECQVRN